MMVMKQIFSLLIIALGLVTVCAQVIKVNRDTESWREARKACRKQSNWGSCDLITQKRLNEEWSKLGLSGEEKLWVGARRLYHWFWEDGTGKQLRLFKDHGCYKLTVSESRLRQQRTNGPYQCYRDCDDQAFVYLQEENCYCSGQLEGEVVSRDKCHLPCDGSDDKCGATKDYFSVYSLPREIRFKDNREDRMCAACQIRDNRLVVESTDCKSSRHYFCLSDKQASQVDSRGTQYASAVSLCKSRYNSSIPSLPSPESAGQYLTDLQALSDKMLGSFFTTFWLPLRRHVRPVWVDGEKGEEGGEFGNCLAVTPRTASYRLTDLSCSHGYGYICDCSSSGVTTANPGKDGDKGKKGGPSKVIIIVVVVFILVLVMVIAVIVFIVRSRTERERRIMEQRWANMENPFYKGSPES